MDPYQVLGVGADASDSEVRAAYRRLVQRHHPDHNHGSKEAARRFEEVQRAYEQVRQLRAAPPPSVVGEPAPAPAADTTAPQEPWAPWSTPEVRYYTVDDARAQASFDLPEQGAVADGQLPGWMAQLASWQRWPDWLTARYQFVLSIALCFALTRIPALHKLLDAAGTGRVIWVLWALAFAIVIMVTIAVPAGTLACAVIGTVAWFLAPAWLAPEVLGLALACGLLCWWLDWSAPLSVSGYVEGLDEHHASATLAFAVILALALAFSALLASGVIERSVH